MIIGIDVVFIHVSEPLKMARWYEEKLGLKINFSTPNNDWQEFLFSKKRPKTRFALDYRGLNPSKIEQQSIIISFKVANIQESVKKLELNGIKFFGKEKIIDVGPSLIATFQDPEGNYLQISQRK